MAERFSIIDLNSAETETQESAIFAKEDGANGRSAVTGKLIQKRGRKISDIKRLLVFLHGLPGFEWSIEADKKARSAVKKSDEDAVFRLFPPGISAGYGPSIFGHEHVPPSEQLGKLFSGVLTLKAYVNYFHQALLAAAELVPRKCELHAAGHSFGALPLLFALSKLKGCDALPMSANLLAPFVKSAAVPKGTHPEIALSLVNSQMEDALNKREDEHRFRLEDIFWECRRYYNLKEGVRGASVDNLLTDHHRLFTPGFFRIIGNIADAAKKGCEIRVIRGEKDPFIGPEHSDLIAQYVGLTRSDIESVLHGDGHDLASLNFEDLFSSGREEHFSATIAAGHV